MGSKDDGWRSDRRREDGREADPAQAEAEARVPESCWRAAFHLLYVSLDRLQKKRCAGPPLRLSSPDAAAPCVRRNDDSRARTREITREWWSSVGRRMELVTGPPTLIELMRGPGSRVVKRLTLISETTILPLTSAADALATEYVARGVMPRPPSFDALHVALASQYNCDVLLTWDLRHIANPRKELQLRRINAAFGLPLPRLISPLDPYWENLG